LTPSSLRHLLTLYMPARPSKKKRRRDISKGLRQASNYLVALASGLMTDEHQFKGWEVKVIYDESPTKQGHVYMYAAAKDPASAVNLCYKSFDAWHRPEPFGPKYPDVADIPKTTCHDLEDLADAWMEIQAKAVKEKLTVGKSPQSMLHKHDARLNFPQVFMAYPLGKIAPQERSADA